MAEAKPKWFNDKVYGRISNIEYPGSPISVRVNGIKTQYQDGFEGFFPKAYVEALSYCVTEEHKLVGAGLPPRITRKPRFMFNELAPPEKTDKEENIVSEVVKERVKTKTVTVEKDDISGDVQSGSI